MNAAQKARLEYLRELPSMEIESNISAQLKAADYNAEFNRKYERREIRRAGERAHWINIVLPLIKAAKRNSGTFPEARSV
jgi:hypothetical protein